jgi:hypothetical protein
MWKIDPITNTSIIIYMKHVSKSETIKRAKGGGNKEKIAVNKIEIHHICVGTRNIKMQVQSMEQYRVERKG